MWRRTVILDLESFRELADSDWIHLNEPVRPMVDVAQHHDWSRHTNELMRMF